MRSFAIFVLLTLQLGLAVPLSARSKQEPPKVVDAGTFSILIGGRKVGTETFSIRQSPDQSTVTSEIRIDDGSGKARQTSEIRLSYNGDLKRYEWHELQPGKGEIILEPQDEFLVEHVNVEKDKHYDQPFLMPASTSVLDDFFFSHREILAWRYLAAVCKSADGQTKCVPQKSQFGVIIPRQHASTIASIEYISRERLTLNGKLLELNHLRISMEDSADWDLWLDDTHRLMRILIPGMNTEILRDEAVKRAKDSPSTEPLPDE